MANLKFSPEVVRNSEHVVDGIVQTKKIKYPWPTYNSSILDYMIDLDPALKDLNLIDFISNRPNPVILDFLATPSALKDLFMRANVTPGQGITVGFEDLREARDRKLDLILYGTVQVTGDLNERATWHEVGSILGDDKADLILQRGRGGVSNLPAEKHFYNAARRHLWAALNENNGLLVSQVHDNEKLKRNGIDLADWTERVKAVGVDALYIPGVPFEKRTFRQDCFGILKLVKTPLSPQKLPLL